jgi:hypothetical protein
VPVAPDSVEIEGGGQDLLAVIVRLRDDFAGVIRDE